MKQSLVNCCPVTLNQSIIGELRRSLVVVEYLTFGSAYQFSSPYLAVSSGFIIDAARNWVITSKHSVSWTSFGTITIKFSTEEQSAAKLYYTDPQHDFAVLLADYIPSKFKLPIQLSQSLVMDGDYIFMLGDGKVINYLFEDGYILSTYKNMGLFLSQSLISSIANQPGSSGAPIFGSTGQIVGLHFSGDGVYSSAVPSPYIVDTLNDLRKGIIPVRKSLGAYFEYCNLAKLKQYGQLPAQLIAGNEDGLCIKRIIPDTPAYMYLKVADVLWSIEDIYIGANLYLLERLINLANESIKLSIYRYGNQQEFILQPYDLTSYQITKMLYMGGIMFFAADELSHLKSGVPLGKVFTSITGKDMPIKSLTYASIEAVAGVDITTLENLINISNSSYLGRDLVVIKKPYLLYHSYSNTLLTHHNEQAEYVHLPSSDHIFTLEYNSSTYDWHCRTLNSEEEWLIEECLQREILIEN